MGLKMTYCFVTALVLLATFQSATGAKILMKSMQAGSHVLEQIALGEELASRGHEVYMAIGSRYAKMASIEKRGIKTLPYKVPDGVMYGISEEFEKMVAGFIFDNSENKRARSARVGAKLGDDDCAYMMEDKAFLEKVKQLKFDVAIVESFLFSQCNLILPKYAGIPFITISGLIVPWHIRIPALPSFVNFMSPWTESADITFTSRFVNLLGYFAFDFTISGFAPDNNTLLELYAPNCKSWKDLLRESELFLVGRDHHLSACFPAMPNYISVAGLNAVKPSNLPKDLEDLAAKSDGIILLSFGSTAYYFPEDVIVKFLEAFSKLKETVLVKFFIPEGVKVPPNVKALSWLPQNDILGHPKTKLFITHCGINGQHEALYNGVPMIGFPLFAEQHQNCQRAAKKGFGLELNIQDFTSDQLLQNIQEVINNPKYRSTIREASEVFRDQPMTARQRGAFWVEHVIKHGGKHLRMPGMDLPLYQFFMFDVLFVIVFCVVAVLLILRCTYRCLCNRSKQAKLKTN